MRKELLILFLLLPIACQKETISVCDSEKKLRDVADFRVGTTFDQFRGSLYLYGEVVGEHFNRISSENALKMDRTVLSYSEFDFFPYASLSREGKFNKLQAIHIHPVIWHKQVPKWLPDLPADSLESFLKNYCTKFREYLGYTDLLVVDGIDVVNEALNEDGSMRQSFWYQAMGKDFLTLAYKEFSKLDPAIKLFYNDYNLESNPVKLDAALDLCDWLREQGVRVDGIGMQMHITIHEPSISDMAAAVQKIIDRGYMIHFSELDISLNPYGKYDTATPELLNKQAERYYEVFRLYQEIPKDLQYGITVWGLADPYSWIPDTYARFDAPLILGESFEPKPAYCSCLNALEK
ncbi:MAG TPA: hypothetical protein DIW47_00565 [Bacteroidetes bacterium]|nr:hypothetical protein [Bacteroidota bacterium]